MEQTSDPLANIKARLLSATTSGRSIFNLMGRDFWVDPGVFPPTLFHSTTIFSQDLPYPVGGSFWEVGCGTGVTSVIAALQGCKRVVASDISTDATNNTRCNVQHHSVSSIVSVRCGDLFDVLAKGEKFDVIYWNSNFIHVPEGYEFESTLHRAFADAGYRSHDRFLREAPRYLEPNGRILLGFSSQGDRQALERLLSAHQYASRIVSSRAAPGQQSHQFEIVELTPR